MDFSAVLAAVNFGGLISGLLSCAAALAAAFVVARGALMLLGFISGVDLDYDPDFENLTDWEPGEYEELMAYQRRQEEIRSADGAERQGSLFGDEWNDL